MMGEDAGTRTLLVRGLLEACMGNFEGSVLIAVVSNSGEAGPGSLVPGCDGEAVASTGTICGAID